MSYLRDTARQLITAVFTSSEEAMADVRKADIGYILKAFALAGVEAATLDDPLEKAKADAAERYCELPVTEDSLDMATAFVRRWFGSPNKDESVDAHELARMFDAVRADALAKQDPIGKQQMTSIKHKSLDEMTVEELREGVRELAFYILTEMGPISCVWETADEDGDPHTMRLFDLVGGLQAALEREDRIYSGGK